MSFWFDKHKKGRKLGRLHNSRYSPRKRSLERNRACSG